jgi:hypothetical protein
MEDLHRPGVGGWLEEKSVPEPHRPLVGLTFLSVRFEIPGLASWGFLRRQVGPYRVKKPEEQCHHFGDTLGKGVRITYAIIEQTGLGIPNFPSRFKAHFRGEWPLYLERRIHRQTGNSQNGSDVSQLVGTTEVTGPIRGCNWNQDHGGLNKTEKSVHMYSRYRHHGEMLRSL